MSMNDVLEEMKELNDLISSKKKKKTNPKPMQNPEIPPKQWWHTFGDALTRRDELLEAILIQLQTMSLPSEEPTPIPPPPTLPPPEFPPGIEPKLDSLITEQFRTRLLLEGFKFKSNQNTIVTTGVAQQSIHQFKSYFILIRADSGNVADVGIGPKGVTTGTSYNLGPGESCGMSLDVLKVGLYIVGTVGDSVSWMALI